MLNKIFLPTILAILTYGFWISPDFKEISAGVAIFLFGMLFLQQGFKAFTGGILEKILQKSNDRMWKSLLFGFSASTLMQSSSLVSILTISFLSAELITLIQGLGILFGANIGTTTGAWLIAAFGMKINISAYAMPMLVFGMIFSFQKSKNFKGFGSILAGLGFLFLGIHYMKVGFESFQTSINLIEYAMTGFVGILVFVGIGILATIVMQSSHATIILVIAALATNQVTYENALALVIGANIGTTITAVLGSLTGNINGKRLAIADVLFKVITGIIFIIFLQQIIGGVNILGNILGIEQNDFTLKLALFHTIFNLIGVIIIVPFISKLINIVNIIFPDKDKDVNNLYGNLYLNNTVFDFPDTALISLLKEVKHLYKNTLEVLIESIGLEKKDIEGNYNFKEIIKKVNIIDSEEIDELYNKKIKFLYGEIIDFATKAQANNHDKYINDFYKIRYESRRLVDVIKSIKQLQKNVNKYLKSTNLDIKYQYEKIIQNLIETIKLIEELSNKSLNEEKLILIAKIEISTKENDIISNGIMDSLIRENKITNEMATSLINDSNYKNLALNNLLEIAEFTFNNDISEEITEIKNKKNKKINNWFNKTFGLSGKELDKSIKKLKRRKLFLKDKIKKEKEKEVLLKFKEELKDIEFIIEKYKR
ncbi:MAG: Na/Pi symporter [Candidatus Gracilibacteria bacterium]|nr:Na/Pi symporter [Candidatus Gracilibacteria bacterium]